MFDGVLSFFRRLTGEARSGNPDMAANYSFANMTELIDALSVTPTASGVLVTPLTAQQSAAVLACVRLLSETVAALPKHLMIFDGKQRMQALDHQLYMLLHAEPNPEMTSFTYFELMMRHLLLRGNSYSQIVAENTTGEITELWPLHPDYVRPRRDQVTRQIVYDVITVAGMVTLPAGQVLHVKSFGENGLVGLSMIQMARQSIGAAISADEFGSRFYQNNARPGGYWTVPAGLPDKEFNATIERLKVMHGGLYNAHKMAVVEDGNNFHDVNVSQKDSQFLETRQYQTTEIARCFRVPPHKIGDLSKSSFSNIEQQSIDFVNDGLMSWIVRITQELNRALIPSFERRTHTTMMECGHLLRGTMKERYESYNVAVTGGWMTRNEAREAENMNPLDGLDEPLQALNMGSPGGSPKLTKRTGQDANDEPSGEPSGNSGDLEGERSGGREKETRAKKKDPRETAKRRLKLRSTYRPLIRDAAARCVKRECEDVGRIARRCLAQRTAADLERELTAYYEKHGEFLRTAFTPILRTYFQHLADECAAEIGAEDYSIDIDELVTKYLDAFIARHNGSAQGQMMQLAGKGGDEDPLTLIEERLAEWEEKTADKMADNESVRGEGYLSKALFMACGVTRLRWSAGPTACPICQQMEGKVVGIESNFVDEGETINVEDGDDLTSQTSIGGPPLHGGCSCCITAD